MLMPRLPQEDMEHILEHTGSLWDKVRGQSIFLTGGTGFVGTWLLESLLWATDKLDLRISVVVLTRDPDKFRIRSPHLAGHPSTRLLGGDMLRFNAPTGIFPFVIHAATEQHVEPHPKQPLGVFESDVNGMRTVLEFARRHGVRRLLFTSSGAVYGKQLTHLTHIPEDYTGAPSTMDTSSAYGHAKRLSEFMCSMYAQTYSFEATIARLFTFIGPLLPLDAKYAAGNFINDALKGAPVRVRGDGTAARSYLYAADLAVWLWTILLRGQQSHPYNVGSSEAITVADLAYAVGQYTKGVEITREAMHGAAGDLYVPATKRAEEELGLQSWIGLAEGVKRTLQWHRGAGFQGTGGA